jgi:hypothetical protein
MGTGFPRRFVETTHNGHCDGVCHGIGVTPEGRPFAILEYKNGRLQVRYLDEAYEVTLEIGLRSECDG